MMASIVAPALNDEPLEPVLPFGVREEEDDEAAEDESYDKAMNAQTLCAMMAFRRRTAASIRPLVNTFMLRKKDTEANEDEFESLVAVGEPSKGEKNLPPVATPPGPSTGFSFSIKRLANVTLLLLILSHLSLERQCFHARMIREASPEPFVSEWRLLTKHKHLVIRKYPKNNGGYLDEVAPNETIKVIGVNSTGFTHVISPALGWTQHISKKTNLPYFERVRDDPDVSSICPLVYTAINAKPSSRYMNAPLGLVFGQCLWNATQVFHILLLIAMLYEVTQPNELPETQSFSRKVGVWCIAVVTVCLLPFAAYLISPGAHIWACLTLILSLLATFTPTERLHLSALSDPCSGWRLLIYEETLCMLCYLGSSLYNSSAGAAVKRWPWFHLWWRWVDDALNLDSGGDVTPRGFFNMGVSSWNVPPFVSGAYGSVTASYVFMGVWSVLPFLYAFNFIIMIVMSSQSPGKWVQRFFATFGLIHFLFWTDIVSYKYGRGYRNDHEDFYHWTEKWSWRIGILIPLYQNCTNGHWGRNAHSFPIVGQIQRYFAMVWGILFFIFQTIQSDLIRTYAFLTDGDSSKGLIKICGLEKKSHVWRKLDYPYFTALVWMWVMYFLLQVTCFKLNRITLQRADTKKNKYVRDSTREEEWEGLVKSGPSS